jgi:cytochrome c oxidase cbb3-type subunit 4
MALDHQSVVFFAKTFGLFYLLAMSIGVVIYTYWPSRKRKYDRAAEMILEGEDKPCR